MKDSHGRNIRYLRVSVTDRCNLRCKYCMPEEGVGKKKHLDILSLEEIYQIIEASEELGFDKIRLTGGEPLVRKNIEWLIKKTAALEGIKDISMTTNGILLADYAEKLKNAGLNRVNISLDTLNPEKFKAITRGGNLSDVLRGIEAAIHYGLTPIKINTVLIGGFNDDEIEELADYTMNHDIHVRFIELMPIGMSASWSNEKFISNETVLERLGNLVPLEMEPGSPSKEYRMHGAKGTIGLINPISQHFCSTCNRLRLTADGKLKPCLHSNKEIDVRKGLGNKEEIKKIIVETIDIKPREHHINDKDYKPITRDMNGIGG
jgi:cyclic pyranopterin phosphate synthase